jgi:hypothetical protein
VRVRATAVLLALRANDDGDGASPAISAANGSIAAASVAALLASGCGGGGVQAASPKSSAMKDGDAVGRSSAPGRLAWRWRTTSSAPDGLAARRRSSALVVAGTALPSPDVDGVRAGTAAGEPAAIAAASASPGETARAREGDHTWRVPSGISCKRATHALIRVDTSGQALDEVRPPGAPDQHAARAHSRLQRHGRRLAGGVRTRTWKWWRCTVAPCSWLHALCCPPSPACGVSSAGSHSVIVAISAAVTASALTRSGSHSGPRWRTFTCARAHAQ